MKVLKRLIKVKLSAKATLCIVSALALTAVGGVATHASFSDAGSSSITGTSGTLDYTLTHPIRWIDSWYSLREKSVMAVVPYSTTTTIKNTGTVPLKYNVIFTINSNGNSPLYTEAPKVIDVQILAGTTQLYSGKLDKLVSTSQTLAVGSSQAITIKMTLPFVSNMEDYTHTYAAGTMDFTVTNV